MTDFEKGYRHNVINDMFQTYDVSPTQLNSLLDKLINNKIDYFTIPSITCFIDDVACEAKTFKFSKFSELLKHIKENNFDEIYIYSFGSEITEDLETRYALRFYGREAKLDRRTLEKLAIYFNSVSDSERNITTGEFKSALKNVDEQLSTAELQALTEFVRYFEKKRFECVMNLVRS